ARLLRTCAAPSLPHAARGAEPEAPARGALPPRVRASGLGRAASRPDAPGAGPDPARAGVRARRRERPERVARGGRCRDAREDWTTLSNSCRALASPPPWTASGGMTGLRPATVTWR